MVDPAKTYDGSPCKNCGLTLKWRSNRDCVECNRARTREEPVRRCRLATSLAWYAAKSEDHVWYYGTLLRTRRRRALKRMEARHNG